MLCLGSSHAFLALRSHGSLPRKGLNVLYQAHTWSQQGTPSSHRSTAKTPWLSSAPNQPQYELSHQFFGSCVNLVTPGFAVFELPDELILSLLPHIYPLANPRHAGHYPQFRIHDELVTDDYYYRLRARFLRPLSMTCRPMWLRLMPWIWEHINLPKPYSRSSGETVRKLNAIVNVLRTGTYLATSVRYFCVLLYPWVGTDSCPPKVHDSGSLVE